MLPSTYYYVDHCIAIILQYPKSQQFTVSAGHLLESVMINGSKPLLDFWSAILLPMSVSIFSPILESLHYIPCSGSLQESTISFHWPEIWYGIEEKSGSLPKQISWKLCVIFAIARKGSEYTENTLLQRTEEGQLRLISLPQIGAGGDWAVIHLPSLKH